MNIAKFIRNTTLALLATTTLAFAQERGTADEAKALVEKGLSHVKAVGAEQAFADFSDKDSGKWLNKDLYIVVLKYDGTILAHGVNKGLLGKNLMDVKDPNGVYFTKEMIESGKKGGGWTDYGFTDPVTKKIAAKSSYTKSIPGSDAVLGVGIYKK
jgi:signal transduction histidine kinase